MWTVLGLFCGLGQSQARSMEEAYNSCGYNTILYKRTGVGSSNTVSQLSNCSCEYELNVILETEAGRGGAGDRDPIN